MPSLLLDTNIWLDDCFGERPKHAQARQLLVNANAKDVAILFAAHSSKDIFRLAELGAKQALRSAVGTLDHKAAAAARTFAWSYLDYMGDIATPVGCDASDVWMAKKQRSIHSEYEDDLVIAAAMRANASFIVTNDEKLLRHCPVAALDVDDALAYLETLDM